MPMVELTTTKGALDEATKERLAGELATIALELEAAPLDFGDDPDMQALAWSLSMSRTSFSAAGGTPSRSTASA